MSNEDQKKKMKEILDLCDKSDPAKDNGKSALEALAKLADMFE